VSFFDETCLRNIPVIHSKLLLFLRTRGAVQAMFLRHEGYLGAIGAFLKGASAYNADKYSWRENMYGSTGFPANPSEVRVHLEK